MVGEISHLSRIYHPKNNARFTTAHSWAWSRGKHLPKDSSQRRRLTTGGRWSPCFLQVFMKFGWWNYLKNMRIAFFSKWNMLSDVARRNSSPKWLRRFSWMCLSWGWPPFTTVKGTTASSYLRRSLRHYSTDVNECCWGQNALHECRWQLSSRVQWVRCRVDHVSSIYYGPC